MDDVAFDEAEFRQLVDGPEPSWMDRLTTLSNAMGRHPLYKDIDRGVSSETDVQEEGDGVGREIARRKEAGAAGAAGGGQKSAESISKAVGSATKSASKPQGAKDKGQSRPAPPTLPPSTKAVSRSTRPAPPARPNNAMAVDDTTPAPRQVPETNANAVASTSRLPPPRRPTPIRSAASNPLAKRSTSPPTPASKTTPLSSPALPRPSFLPPPANASVIIDVFSASEDEAEASPPRKKAKRRSSTVRAESSKVLLAGQASKAKLLSPTKGARGSTGSKKKARVSLEAEIAKLKTSAGVKRFKEEIQTVSAYVEHLAQFELDAKGSLPLAGTRVIFVNADHWLPARVAPRRSSSSSSARPLRNRLDPTLRHQVEIAVKQGATLVKPEDFVPPPFDVESEPFDAAQAEREGWTTHIIPFTPSTKQVPVRNATFTEMLSCLGPDVGGIEQDDLGPYVKVVGFGWVSNSVEARGRAVEFPNLISGDFREAAKAISAKDVQRKKEMQERRRKSELEEKKRKAEDAENAKRSGRGRKDKQEDTDEDEEMSDGEGGPPQGISPFGENDFPLGEKPAVAQLDESTSIDPSASSSHPSKRPRTRSPVPPNDEQTGHTSSDPIVDPDQTGRLSPSLGKEKSRSPKGKSRSPADNNDDLQNELAMIKEHGVDVVDQYLDAADKGEGWVTTEKDVDDGFKIMADWAEEDNETDEENEWEERKRRGEVKGERKGFNPNARIRRAKGSNYMCDNPSKGNRNGPNEHVAKTLELLAGMAEKGSFRERGYRQAAGVLRNYPTAVKHRSELLKLRYIGDPIATKVIEIWRTGSHRRIEYTTPKDEAIKVFVKCYGIAAAFAESLWNQGAKNLDDLRADPDRYGLYDTHKLGLQYYDDLLERIPRDEVTALFQIIKDQARKIDLNIELHCMGSYRRGEPDCGDIDVLLTMKPVNGKTHRGYVTKLWERLCKVKLARNTLTLPTGDADKEDASVHGLCKLPGVAGAKMRRIDILGVPYDELPAALIYFTGNDYFNRSLRLKARHLGYRLNQHGLYSNVARGAGGLKLTEGKRVEGLDTEEKLLNRLGVRWRRPEERKP